MADPERGKLVQVDGVPVGTLFATFECGDDLIEQLRRRATYIGLSYGMIEDLAGMAEGAITKYLSAVRTKQLTMSSMLRIAEVLGLRAQFIVDPKLVAQMAPAWGKRDGRRVHTNRQVPLGQATLRRVLKPVAAELGRRGGIARMAALSAEQRRLLGLRAVEARWFAERQRRRIAAMPQEPAP